MSAKALQNNDITRTAIHQVIADGLITPAYQAIYDIGGNKILGFEALARCPDIET